MRTNHRDVYAVDVISYSGIDGEIRPLRVRIPEYNSGNSVGRVREILQSSENHTFGIESRTFLCRIYYGEDSAGVLSELKYYIRSHAWYLSGPGGNLSHCAADFFRV